MEQPVMLWSRLPPPAGGVTVSAVRVIDALADRNQLAGVVDLGAPRTWANGLGRSYHHLFWCSTPAAARHHARLARVARGRRSLIVHGGDPVVGGQRRRGASPFETVFATNDILAAHLETTGLGQQVIVASPWVPLTSGAVDRADHGHAGHPSAPPVGRDDPLRILVAVGPNLAWYGLDLAIDVARSLRERRGVEAVLTVLGPVGDHVVAGHPPYVRAEGQVPADAVPGLLAEHDLVLRPTSTDGDSILVRDALHAGLRVVASDVVPRPAGVELAPPETEAFADAVQSGGPVSDGHGTGPPLLDLL